MASTFHSVGSGESEGVEGQGAERILNAREVAIHFDGMVAYFQLF